jgi:hypothetical protein
MRRHKMPLPLIVPILVSLLATACDGTRVECDCAYPNGAFVDVTDPQVVQLSASGAACSFGPICVVHADGGSCAEYEVQFSAAGTCHLTATNADGRQATADLTVRVIGTDSCCGTGYASDPAGPLTFSFTPADQDGSAADGG